MGNSTGLTLQRVSAGKVFLLPFLWAILIVLVFFLSWLRKVKHWLIRGI